MPLSGPTCGSGSLDGRVDRLHGDRLLGHEGQVDDRDVGGRDADGKAVWFACHLEELTSFRALAAPVELGIMLERGRRERDAESLCGVSRMTWSLV